MGTNFIQPGVDIKLATGTGLSANDPFLYGDFLPCVLMTDAETASPYYAACRTSGVFDLSVEANNGSPAAAQLSIAAIFSLRMSLPRSAVYTRSSKPSNCKKTQPSPAALRLCA